MALGDHSPEKAGVGGSTPSRGTNCFAATSPHQNPFTLRKIDAFSGGSHGRQVDVLDVLERFRLGWRIGLPVKKESLEPDYFTRTDTVFE